MIGTIAPTDFDWYTFLSNQGDVEEVNFWRPSAARAFKGAEFSPFLFKLKKPHNAICGFGYFARYSALPIWLAWDTFGLGNGCASERAMVERIQRLRLRMEYRGTSSSDHIGCILIVSPIFFLPSEWIPQPSDWPGPSLGPVHYDLSVGEGQRVWQECLVRAKAKTVLMSSGEARYGQPALVQPRLGQGTFRVAVTDAYQRACAISREHSLPALEASHIRPYADEGPHDIRNGLLLRADFHRLFDQGYITVTPELCVEVSARLKADFANGRTYYPFHGTKIHEPDAEVCRPKREFLEWHNTSIYKG